jgi:Tol biopolymer transport system component
MSFRTSLSLVFAVASLVGCGGRMISDAPGDTVGTHSGVTPHPGGGSDPGKPKTGNAPQTGAWIAFDSDLDGVPHIWVAEITPALDATAHRLTSESLDEREPAFSPDGRAVAFTSDRDGTSQIWVLDLPSGTVAQVTHAAGGADQPAFSPDGERIAFHTQASVHIVDADGANERLVKRGPDTLNAFKHPVFVADGSGLVMDRGNLIAFMKEDGSAYREILRNTTTTVETPTISPDGKSVAFGLMCGGPEQIWIAPFGSMTDPCRGGTTLVESQSRKPAYGADGSLAFDAGNDHIIVRRTDGAQIELAFGGSEHNPAFPPAGLLFPRSGEHEGARDAAVG